MAIYTGAKCLICSEKFKDEDDVVVCPECGTPYHRACYKEKKCINKELHESGGSWMLKTIEEKEKVPDMKICPNCQALNKGDAENCSVCGKSMKVRTLPENTENQSKETVAEEKKDKADNMNIADVKEELFMKIGQDPNEVIDEEAGVTCGDMADFINFLWIKYMYKFKKMENGMLDLSTNLTAFLFPEYFFAARKMYPHTVVVMLLNFLVSVPALISPFEDSIQYYGLYPLFPWMSSPLSECFQMNPSIISIGFALSICIRIVCFFKADGLYLKNTIKKLKKLRGKYSDEEEYRKKIKEEGGISIAAILITFLCAVLLYFILCTVVTIMNYL